MRGFLKAVVWIIAVCLPVNISSKMSLVYILPISFIQNLMYSAAHSPTAISLTATMQCLYLLMQIVIVIIMAHQAEPMINSY